MYRYIYLTEEAFFIKRENIRYFDSEDTFEVVDISNEVEEEYLKSSLTIQCKCTKRQQGLTCVCPPAEEVLEEISSLSPNRIPARNSKLELPWRIQLAADWTGKETLEDIKVINNV